MILYELWQYHEDGSNRLSDSVLTDDIEVAIQRARMILKGNSDVAHVDIDWKPGKGQRRRTYQVQRQPSLF